MIPLTSGQLWKLNEDKCGGNDQLNLFYAYMYIQSVDPDIHVLCIKHSGKGIPSTYSNRPPLEGAINRNYDLIDGPELNAFKLKYLL